MKYRLDGIEQADRTATVVTSAEKFGDVFYGFTVFGEQTSLNVAEAFVEIGAPCRRVQPYYIDETTNDDFFLSELLWDFESMGKHPSERV